MIAERNEQLEQELNDMKQLMYVVAPQHYIDDEALQFNNNNSRVQYTKPVEIQYECLTAGHEVCLSLFVSSVICSVRFLPLRFASF